MRLAEEFGADHTVNAAETTSEERIALVRSLTRGRGADIVVECAGIAEVVPEGLDMTRKGGIYLEPGNFAETGEVSFKPAPPLLLKEYPSHRHDQPPLHGLYPQHGVDATARRSISVRKVCIARIPAIANGIGDAKINGARGVHEGGRLCRKFFRVVVTLRYSALRVLVEAISR